MEWWAWEVEETRYFLRIDEKGRNEERGVCHIFVVLCIAGDILSAVNCQSYET
jgi:hypothetical protein